MSKIVKQCFKPLPKSKKVSWVYDENPTNKLFRNAQKLAGVSKSKRKPYGTAFVWSGGVRFMVERDSFKHIAISGMATSAQLRRFRDKILGTA